MGVAIFDQYALCLGNGNRIEAGLLRPTMEDEYKVVCALSNGTADRMVLFLADMRIFKKKTVRSIWT